MPPTSSAAPELRPATAGRPPLEIHRSARRRRTSQAAFVRGRVVVRLPAGLDAVAEEAQIDELVHRVVGRARAQARGGDQALRARADRLADTYMDGIRATTVTWSGRMRRQRGSCRPSDGSLRISRDLARHPDHVLDYVLIHELAHLQVPDHSRAFHDLVARYPRAERARGYLDGFDAGWLAAVSGGGADDQSDPASSPSSS